MNKLDTDKKQSIKDLIANHQIGWSLDQRFYTDPDIYEAELDHLITQNWILVGGFMLNLLLIKILY